MKKKLEILKEIYFIIGQSTIYPECVTTEEFVIIPDYESVTTGAHGLYLDWQSKTVRIAEVFFAKFDELIIEYNDLCDYEDQIERYPVNF